MSSKLAGLASEVQALRFSYRVKKDASPEYWRARAGEVERYVATVSRYHVLAHSAISDRGEAALFLVQAGRFRQLAAGMLEAVRDAAESPSAMSPDGQQSAWSRDLRSRVEESSARCMGHEKDMGMRFRRLCASGLVGEI